MNQSQPSLPKTWHDIPAHIASRLGWQSSDPRVRWISEEVAGMAFESFGPEPIPKRAANRLEKILEDISEGRPLQYALGSWQFGDLDLFVDERVLIPRPETECLVEEALNIIDGLPEPPLVVDVGTGSGAISLAIASKSNATVIGLEISTEALAVARANLGGQGSVSKRVTLIESDLFSGLTSDQLGGVGLVVSNPPYVSESEYGRLDDVVKCEPYQALVGGDKGTEIIEKIIVEAKKWLEPNGWLLIEMAPHQGDAMVAIAAANGYLASVKPDLAGRDRLLVAQLIN